MREGQLWTALIGLAVATVLGIAGIPATAHQAPASSTATTTTTLGPLPAP
jgi:hypothetical protein